MLIFHGMGQQVRYETLGLVAKSLLDRAEQEWCAAYPDAVAHPFPQSSRIQVFEQGGEQIARAELDWTDAKGNQHSVHLYEAYWAPITEGKVGYWDTVKFLTSAAWSGLKESWKPYQLTFQRWMFGELKEMEITGGTFVALGGILLFLLLTVGAITYITAQTASIIKELSPLNFRSLLSPHNALWFVLIGIAYYLRNIIIQYPGSVAAYISPYKDSKFDDIRRKIRKVGLDMAKLIYGYGGTQPPTPEYNRVVFVGHSLGSVIAYDTLNAVHCLDNIAAAVPATNPNGLRLSDDFRDIVTRTRALITFGSPLDKTAFLFRTQPNHVKDPLREQMAAGVQPLIVSVDYRPKDFRWINIWCKKDIISGSLDYYDDPAWHQLPVGDPIRNCCVDNRIDKDAVWPLAAHIEYWQHEELAKTLYEEAIR
jgi:hypothetical protein